MSHRNKISAFKVFVFCLVLISIRPFCLSYIFYNGSTGGYIQNTLPPGLQGIQENISMYNLVIHGAGYYIKANSNIQSLLNTIEWQDIKAIDYLYLKQMVKSALMNITQARAAIEELVKIAAVTPYNLDVIGQLNRFDYDSFQEEYGLNPFIFGMVRNYLEKGDITGIYMHAFENIKEIEQLLTNIQSTISENKLPVLAVCWRLNEICSEEALFGSYIARIFNEIK